MSDDGVIVIGIPETVRALADYPRIAEPHYRAATEAALLDTVGTVAEYPPGAPNSTYRRTGTLGRTWTSAQPEFRSMGTGFEGSIGNATPYAPYVQGDEQARVHRGRWWKVESIVKARTERIESFFKAATRKIVALVNQKL